jgi:hypothetical protein
LKWSRGGKYHENSNCGRYRVTAYRVSGKWKFQAIRNRGEVSLLIADTADECKSACSEDSR